MIFFDSIKTYLSSLACVVGAILVFLTDAIKPPAIPDNFPEPLSNMEGFTKFIIASVILLLTIPFLKYSNKKFQIKWWIVSIVCILIAIVSYNIYTNFTEKVIVYDEHNKSTFIIGNQYTPYAQLSINTIKRKDPRTLITPIYCLDNLAGDGGPDDIWTRDSIFYNSKKYFLTYAITSLFLVLFLLTALQAAIGLTNKTTKE